MFQRIKNFLFGSPKVDVVTGLPMPTEYQSGNIFLRPTMRNAPKDTKIDGHRHNFDHTSFVCNGSVHVKAKRPDGTVLEKIFVAPTYFLVRADTEHEITALGMTYEEAKDSIKDLSKDQLIEKLATELSKGANFFCIYSHRTPQGEVSVEATGWEDAYV